MQVCSLSVILREREIHPWAGIVTEWERGHGSDTIVGSILRWAEIDLPLVESSPGAADYEAAALPSIHLTRRYSTLDCTVIRRCCNEGQERRQQIKFSH